MIPFLLNFFYMMLLEFIRSNLKHFNGRPILKAEEELPSVSVVVALRNEKEHFAALTAALLRQRYSGIYEILFVNDHSNDGTELAANYPQGIRLLHLPVGSSGKKAALAYGIGHASGKWIVTTDADTLVKPGWISSLIEPGITSSAVMVCGRADVASNGSFLQDFQQMETRILQGSGAALLDAGVPLLNSGASLAFRKDAWTAVDGYSSHEHLASGDDVFLLFDMHRNFPGRIIFSSHPDAVAITKAVEGLPAMLKQRRRWAGKMKHYSRWQIHLVSLVVLSAVAGLLTAAFCRHWLLLLGLFLLRGFSELRLLRVASGNLAQPSLFNRLGMVVFYPVFLVFLSIAVLLPSPEWKRR